MKTKKVIGLLTGLTLMTLTWVGCNDQPTIELQNDEICIHSSPKKEDCKQIALESPVILRKKGTGLDLSQLSGTDIGGGNGGAADSTFARLRNTLRTKGMLFRYDPKTMKMDWDGPKFLVKDARNEKILLNVSNKLDPQIFILPSMEKRTFEISAATVVGCDEERMPVKDALSPETNVISICGMQDDQCNPPKLTDMFGPVIQVDIPNITNPDPTTVRVISRNNPKSPWQWEESGIIKFINFIHIDPLGGNDPQTTRAYLPHTSQLRSESALPEFQLAFSTSENGLYMHGCLGQLVFTRQQKLLASLTVPSRIIVIERDQRDTTKLNIYVSGTRLEGDWVDRENPDLTVSPGF